MVFWLTCNAWALRFDTSSHTLHRLHHVRIFVRFEIVPDHDIAWL